MKAVLHMCHHTFLQPFTRSCYAIVAFGLDRFLPDWWESGFDDINEKTTCNETLLTIAVTKDQLSAAEGLIRKGADVNIKGGNFGSPLGAAAYYGQKEIVELLLASI